MKKFSTLVLAPALLLIGGCASTPEITMTPLQIQAMQQRDFDVPKDALFASIVSVFQDLGYQVQGADLETGFISAIGNSENATGFFEAYVGSSKSRQTQATAFVETFGEGRSRVRLNFVEATSSSTVYGSNQRVSNSLLEPGLYQAAYERIEEALFVRGALSGSAASN